MVHSYAFEDLRRYSVKEYKFQQRKSMPHPDSEGECLALCLMWIKEKITSSSFPWLRSSIFASRGSNVHAHNRGIMQAARSLGGHRTFAQNETIVNLLGLDYETGRPAMYVNRRRSRGYDLDESLIGLVADLQPGMAACVKIRIGNRPLGHAVALYRSRSGHIHFFDPNCGIYTVRYTSNFMQAWTRGCENRGWRLMTPDVRGGAQTSWCDYYPRR